MTVETVTTIADLNPANPTGAEAKSDGDDHIRAIKQAIKATFPNIAAPVTVTDAELNLLAGVEDLATQADIDAAVFAATLPAQAGNTGKYLKTDGTDAAWETIVLDGRGDPVLDKGSSGTTAQVINYANGDGQTLTITGSCSITTTGWPVGRIAGVLLRLINGGAYPITTTGINWFKADGTKTTTFASSGIALQTTGETLLLLFSYGDGTVYGKAA